MLQPVAEHGVEPDLPALGPDELVRVVHRTVPREAAEEPPVPCIQRVLLPERQHVVKKGGPVLPSEHPEIGHGGFHWWNVL